jgi:hypothetical protein
MSTRGSSKPRRPERTCRTVAVNLSAARPVQGGQGRIIRRWRPPVMPGIRVAPAWRHRASRPCPRRTRQRAVPALGGSAALPAMHERHWPPGRCSRAARPPPEKHAFSPAFATSVPVRREITIVWISGYPEARTSSISGCISRCPGFAHRDAGPGVRAIVFSSLLSGSARCSRFNR